MISALYWYLLFFSILYVIASVERRRKAHRKAESQDE